jgi:hypothetical protein
LRPCVTRTAHERSIEALEQQLEALSRQQPQKVTERHLLFRQLAIRDATAGALSQRDAVAATQRCMRAHAEVFAGLDPEKKVRLARVRARWVAGKKEEAQRRKQELMEARDELLAAQQRALVQQGHPNHIGTMRFTDQELAEICWIIGDFSALAEQRQRWQARTSVPRAPEVEAQRIIDRAAAGIPALADRRPWWCGRVAMNRGLFQGVALGRHRSAEEIYLVVFAKKQPVSVSFLRLRRRAFLWPDHDGERGHAFRLVDRPWFKTEFDFWPVDCVHEVDVPLGEDAEIFIWEGLRFNGAVVSTCHRPVRFEDFVATHPRRAAVQVGAQPPRPTRPSQSQLESLLAEHPWLTELDLRPMSARHGTRGVFSRQRSRGAASSSSPLAGDAGEDVSMSGDEQVELGHDVPTLDGGGAREAQPEALRPEDAAQAVDDLLQLRQEWDYDLGEAQEFFFVRILGGPWTRAHRGVPADSVGAFARAGVGKAWC